MSSSRQSAAEPESIAKMGPELGSLYDALWQEVAWLYSKWEEYETLFGTSQSRVELLNTAAPAFFRIVQDTLWEDILLHVARLIDPSQSGRGPNLKLNLSIRRLPSAISNDEVRVNVEAAIDRALKASGFCRDWRNRHIAHRDLHLALGHGADALEPASRQKVRDALASLADVLNVIAKHYLDNITRFMSVADIGGALDLLYIVDEGVRALQARQQRLESGNPMPEDWQPRSL